MMDYFKLQEAAQRFFIDYNRLCAAVRWLQAGGVPIDRAVTLKCNDHMTVLNECINRASSEHPESGRTNDELCIETGRLSAQIADEPAKTGLADRIIGLLGQYEGVGIHLDSDKKQILIWALESKGALCRDSDAC